MALNGATEALLLPPAAAEGSFRLMILRKEDSSFADRMPPEKFPPSAGVASTLRGRKDFLCFFPTPPPLPVAPLLPPPFPVSELVLVPQNRSLLASRLRLISEISVHDSRASNSGYTMYSMKPFWADGPGDSLFMNGEMGRPNFFSMSP